MSELSELAPAEAPAATPAEEKPKRRLWPFLAWGAIAAVVVVAGTVTALGTTGALIAGGCVAGTAVAGAVVWRLPQLRKHFAGPRRMSRIRSALSRFGRMSLGGGRKGKLPGLGLGKKGVAGTGRKGAGLGKPAGKGRSGGKGMLGRIGSRLPGAKARASRAARSGGSARSGPVRRAARSAVAAARGSAARRQAAGKASRLRRAGTIAAVVPAAAALAGGRRLRAWIRKRRGKTEPVKDEKPAETAPEPSEPEPPPERKPGLPLTPNTADHPSRRTNMTHQLEDTAEAIHQGIGGFEPENVDDLGSFLQALPATYDAFTSGLQQLADRFGDELPVHSAVVEHIREMASQFAGLFEYGNEAYGIFRNSHENDLERLENPRPGEEFMDVSKQ